MRLGLDKVPQRAYSSRETTIPIIRHLHAHSNLDFGVRNYWLHFVDLFGTSIADKIKHSVFKLCVINEYAQRNTSEGEEEEEEEGVKRSVLQRFSRHCTVRRVVGLVSAQDLIDHILPARDLMPVLSLAASVDRMSRKKDAVVGG